MRSLIRLLSAAGIIGLLAAVALAFSGAASFDPNAACVGNAKLLSNAVLQYARDWDETLPPTVPSNAFRKALTSYVSGPNVFVCPATHTYYVPNPAISNMSLRSFATMDSTVLFQDSPLHSDGEKTVAYLDGTVMHGSDELLGAGQACVNRADRIALGVIQYVQDNDECYPPMKSTAQFETAVMPYVRSRRYFICPATNEHFKPNGALSGRSLASIADPTHTIIFTDPVAHSDGIKTIAYADGHVTHGAYVPDRLKGKSSQTNACIINEILIGLALYFYTVDNDGQYPVFTTFSEFMTALLPYINPNAINTCPFTGQEYTLNYALSGINVADLADPSTTWVLKDSVEHSDGTINTWMANKRIVTTHVFLPSGLSVLNDNRVRLVWSKAGSPGQIWTLSASGTVDTQASLPDTNSLFVSASVDTLGRSVLLLEHGGTATLEYVSQNGNIVRSVDNGPYTGWDPAGMAVGSNNQPHLLWNHFDGVAADWNMTTGVNYIGNIGLGPVTAARAAGIAVGPDNTQRLLWTGLNVSAQIWTLGVNSQFVSAASFNPVQAWTPLYIAVGPDGVTHMLRINTSHHARIWTIAGDGSVSSDIAVVPKGEWSPVTFAVGSDNNYRVLFAGPAGALVEVVNSAGTVLSAHIYERPSA